MSEQNKDDEEISLIDLFAVLLRYRVLICVIMVIAVIGVGAGYFVYSSRQDEVQEPAQTKTYEFKTAIGPAPGTKYLLAEQRLSLYFSYAEVIQAALNDTRQKPPQSADVQQWIPAPGGINAEERIFTAANQKLIFREFLRSGTLEITYKTDESQDGYVFLKSLFAHGKEALEQNIIPLARTYIETYEEIQKNARLPNVESENYIMVKALLDGKTASVAELFDPYVLEMKENLSAKKTSYTTIALVILFGALFFSVFLAFGLNALKNIKNDQEAMQKLREALVKKQ
jgi:hypothetical protein